MKADFSGLSKLSVDLSALQEGKDLFLANTSRVLAQAFLREVKRRTPVGVKPVFETPQESDTAKPYWEGYQGGTLRRAWAVRNVRKKGDVWVATVINPIQYASYVEYGHRQQVGRYVPAIGGKRLTSSWVKGRFMMTLSAEHIEKEGVQYVQREFETYLRRYWGDK